MTSLQARVCTWCCKALESVLCKLFGHTWCIPSIDVGWCTRCGKTL